MNEREMTPEREARILEQAVDAYGAGPQIDMMIEEMSELTKALCKYRRKPAEETFADVLEEMADVQIMLNQMVLIFDDFTEPEIGMVTGAFSLMSVIEMASAEDVHQCNTALELEEIEAYGPGRDGLYHIWMTAWAERFQQPLPLSVFGLERPPQSWQYINEEV